ncbi:CLUMA_CG018146, isoform A [Clunio marinus]|uniref:CLUMA_CG018146, isoform A n=1 Tax=Clunio marinus TaxID=568069 RepID=A0A1J1J3Q2_9DIPT|nr:CLUMA_CG018146, isoform A [Clunio marinus]
MSKSNSLRKAEQLELQASLIAEKREQLAKRAKALKLLESYTQNCRSDETNPTSLLPNDGSFLENFKRLTGATSSTNESASTVPQLNAIPSQLNDIPPSSEQDLNVVVTKTKNESLKLEEIRVPPVASLAGSSIKVPTSKEQLIELVAANGDGYEENLITQFTKNDLSQPIRFLFDKSCVEYLEYRRAVTERRSMDKKYDDTQYETYRSTPSSINASGPLEPKTFGSTQESKAKTVTVIRNDDSESTNSDTETWKEAKERNLKNLKRKAIHSRSRKQQDLSTTDSSDEDNHHDDNARFYDRKFKMSSASSTSSGNSKKSCEQDQQQDHHQPTLQQIEKSTTESSARPPKRKKSRWGEAPEVSTTSTPVKVTTTAVAVTPTTVAKPMLSAVNRSDPALLQYARQNFGTTNLSEDDWKKAEEHYKINLLFQDMQRKRQELDHLAKNGKFKYEYDSDEDVNGGTWEHKLRSQEMEATLKWAEALNAQCEGKHHIGDFLPPEELKKFMEKYQTQKNKTQPDVSDYKEFKLKEDNIGYQMLQKLGWKGEGTSLGASGSGITEPINKAPQRENHQGLGANEVEAPNENDNEYDAYRKRMMLAYRFRPNPLNNPRRAYY